MKTFKIPGGPLLKQTIKGWVGRFIVNGEEATVIFRKKRRYHYRWNARAQGGEKLAHGTSLTETAQAVCGFDSSPQKAARLGVWVPGKPSDYAEITRQTITQR